MSIDEKIKKEKKQILSKSFSQKSIVEKEVLLESYTSNFIQAQDVENHKLELAAKDKESERKHKRYIIKAIIIAIALFLIVIVLIIFLICPSESGVKALDIGSVTISGLIAAFFGTKNKN
ncbi:MAG TPA: hypothetical protein PLH98_19940 [Ruminococcus flavefaciens]|nr:hypothetical protein [Ruminococcus flavefaciens]